MLKKETGDMKNSDKVNGISDWDFGIVQGDYWCTACLVARFLFATKFNY